MMSSTRCILRIWRRVVLWCRDEMKDTWMRDSVELSNVDCHHQSVAFQVVLPSIRGNSINHVNDRSIKSSLSALVQYSRI
jgi:hypothetical protein